MAEVTKISKVPVVCHHRWSGIGTGWQSKISNQKFVLHNLWMITDNRWLPDRMCRSMYINTVYTCLCVCTFIWKTTINMTNRIVERHFPRPRYRRKNSPNCPVANYTGKYVYGGHACTALACMAYPPGCINTGRLSPSKGAPQIRPTWALALSLDNICTP